MISNHDNQPEYYINEKGNLVFTEAYHLKRGYCCGNSCKHCPYDWKMVPEQKRKLLLAQRAENNDQNHK